MTKLNRRALWLATTVLALQAGGSWAAPVENGSITTPLQAYGFNIGDDYKLANYSQLADYWRTLDGQSDRMQLTSIGRTAEGRDQLMAIISSPENLAHLGRYRDIARRMAMGEDMTEAEARKLASEGKAIVWIDGGLHSTEQVSTQHLSQLTYELLSANDPEMLRILDNVIVLVANANPDGNELVADWYMRNADPEEREFESIPRLYHKYVGHDNNRDFVASNMPETENVNRVLYREWFPQIVYNHHQSGPAGMVVFIPTHRDPYNYNLDPLVLMGLENVGAAMNARLITEGKPGGGQRTVAPYTNWASTTLRANALFHNSIGIITEINGHPTPEQLPLVPSAQLPRNDIPMPVAPQIWRFQQAIDYTMSLNRAVLDYASRNPDHLLFNMFVMARNGIEAGQTDTWTVTPKRIAELEAAAARNPYTPDVPGWGMGYSRAAVDPALYETVLHSAAARDPRAYILSADQSDFPRTVGFVNALIKSGIQVQRATAAFTTGGKTYPAGSFVVQTGQPYRAMVLDNFEPQNHPDDIPYPGATPNAPHNVTGYTLAYQMGIQFDRVLDGVDGPFERLSDEVAAPAGRVVGFGRAGYLVSHEINNAFVLKNRLLAAGKQVSWLKTPVSVGGETFPAGTIWIPQADGVRQIVEQGVRDLGFDAAAASTAPTSDKLELRPVRIGLVDIYGGSMSAGWTRWIFENYEFPFEVVHPQDLDAGNLKDRFDVLVFANGTIPNPPSPDRPEREQPEPQDIPAEYRGWLGKITKEKTVLQIDAFLQAGGSVVAVGSATQLAYQLNLPVEDALTETTADGTVRHLPRSKFYVPGSILSSRVDNRNPLAYGMSDTVDVYYYNSPAFRLTGPTAGSRVSWFEGEDPLRSGWAWGAQHLNGASTVLEVPHGRGRVFLMGAEITQLGQSQGTYKFLFNALMYGPAITATGAARRSAEE
ncbi:MAG: peptidase [Brevundimonas sp.]|uniref:M14 family metallopeptidase n=1 Tax=Brevundimonas sp. TaxID=1871086 RepID=UPI000DAFDE22|nr:M14 metallopeptidase family protein [Brevundimonas sp.]PZT98211.1 MAG: peptidase [Brevundimonas sp.]